MIGSIVDARYEMLERIAEGTFFSVFKARDTVVNRDVAVKVLFPRYAANAEFTTRLRRELASAATLSHPAIARVYETGESGGTVYVASEYVRGDNLKERIRRSAPLPLSESVDVAIRIAEGLDYAHRSGFVHGDVTPRNVLVTPDLDVKLTDFGISRAAVGSALVQSNVMLRGVHYLAPEVAQGQEATPPSDAYGLGVILFEMLTGVLPYQGDTPLAVALKHAQEPLPSLRVRNPGVPRALESIVLKALAKDPADRYSSALAMLRDLRRAQECLRLGRPLSWSVLDHDPASSADSRQAEAPLKKTAGRDGWRIASTALLLVVALLLAGLALFLFSGVGMPKDTTVPNIVGRPRSEAETMLTAANLRLKVIEELYNDEHPADHILYSLPEAGRQLKEGREIRVAVSLGPELVTVPSVLNTTLAEAREMVARAGLEIGSVRNEYSDIVPENYVVGQEPRPDQQVPRRSKIALTLSRGPYLAPDTQVLPPAGTPQPPVVPPPPPLRPQRWDVTVEVPDGDQEQEVRIVVVQDGRAREAYKQAHQAGQTFSQTVETTGPALIRVFINDQLKTEQAVGDDAQ